MTTTYVPVLRWKRAEQKALRELYQHGTSNAITPLIELLPSSLEKEAEKIARSIIRAWGFRPAFVDPCHVGRTPKFVSLQKLLSDFGSKVRPVFRLDDGDTAGALPLGCAVRIGRSDFGRNDLRDSIVRRIRKLGGSFQAVDLILDAGFISDYEIVWGRTLQLIASAFPWRSVTYLAGAFPRDLSHLKANDQYEIPRVDWKVWQDQVWAHRENQLPLYGDYTVVHPNYEPPKGGRFSASIRYTFEDYWLIMRGENVFKPTGPKFRQWPAQAQLLCDRPEFRGPTFSPGDAYISRMAAQIEKTGSATTWLEATISHHMIYVATQLESKRAA